jgi:uncharacterized protein YegJ (DUF2314 family)
MKNKQSQDVCNRELVVDRMMARSEQAHVLRADPRGLEKYLGLFVKRGFQVPPNDDGCEMEWMWVEINRHHDGKLCGRLDNHPVYAADVSYGDLVTVQEDEIVAVMQPETTTWN